MTLIKKLAIITTHPIQYNAPLFRLLAERGRIEVNVFYTWGQSQSEVFDARFGIQRSWDIPLLDGYKSIFVHNSSKHPDSNRFWGIMNPGLYQTIKREGFDAVLIYRWSVFSHLYLMQRFGKKPALFFRGDSHLQEQHKGAKGFFKNIMFRFVYRKVDKVFYVGKNNKHYFLHYGFQEQQLVAAPHAVDNQRFYFEAERMEDKAKAARISMDIPEDAVVFLYAGKFYALKQLNLLINTFQQLAGKQYRLLLVGNGEQETMLKELASSDKRILFHPFYNQSDMPWVYRIGDVFVLTSKSETWGLGVNEAMACGRAAIVSNKCGCASDLIEEGVTGYTFKSGNETDLLNKMSLFTDKQFAAEKGKQAFKHIATFSLAQVAQRIEEELINKTI